MIPNTEQLSIYPDDMTKCKVLETCSKMYQHLRNASSVLVSVSGGSDSDCIVHLICTYFPEYLYKIHFAFVNTGLEYQATLQHLSELEKKYDISIVRLRGRPVPAVVREYGIPLLSKFKSRCIGDFVRGLPWAVKCLYCSDGWNSFRFTPNQIALAEYCKQNSVLVSSKCCDLSKKKPLFEYMKKIFCDLNITGERKAEGGQRSLSHKSCFEYHENKASKYMPLFWWSDDDKRNFKASSCIRYSDCYEVYGLRRTGCVGCPFALDIQQNLQALFQYENKLFNACMAVFGRSYEITDMFRARRSKCLPEFFQYGLGVIR